MFRGSVTFSPPGCSLASSWPRLIQALHWQDLDHVAPSFVSVAGIWISKEFPILLVSFWHFSLKQVISPMNDYHLLYFTLLPATASHAGASAAWLHALQFPFSVHSIVPWKLRHLPPALFHCIRRLTSFHTTTTIHWALHHWSDFLLAFGEERRRDFFSKSSGFRTDQAACREADCTQMAGWTQADSGERNFT